MRRLLLFLLFSPLFVFAEEYRWVVLGTNYPNTFRSGTAACAFVKTQVSSITSISFSSTGESTGVCTYFFDNGSSIVGPYSDVYVQRYGDSCPIGTVYKSETGECIPEEPEPEPDQCEAGKETSAWTTLPKIGGLYVPTYPMNACLPQGGNSCEYNYTREDGCYGPVMSGDNLAMRCNVVYTSSGSECSSGAGDDFQNESPPGPDVEENKDCKKFVNLDGSWGFDCNPKPDPDDENNSCPPGYMMQGTTCFRIPPDHPDYDPDKDPNKDPEDPNNPKPGDGDGDKGGDYAKDSTLKEIDKTLKDIDKTTKATESAIKTGNAATHDLLRGIKDAIGNIPGGGGGGGGNQPGGGNGDGDGEGEGGDGLTTPDQGSFDDAIQEHEEKILELKDQIDAKILEIKAFKLPGLSLSGGGGTLPAESLNFGIFGSHDLDFNDFSEPLSQLGSVFVFICSLVSLYIIFLRY